MFDRDYVYGNYIDYFNKIKSTTPKDNPMYLISKLLMNGLYGKTGQDYKLDETVLVSESELLNLVQSKNIEINTINELDSDLNLISVTNNNKYGNFENAKGFKAQLVMHQR